MSETVQTQIGQVVYTYNGNEAKTLKLQEFIVSWDSDANFPDEDCTCVVYAKGKEEINALIDYWNELEHISVYNKIT